MSRPFGSVNAASAAVAGSQHDWLVDAVHADLIAADPLGWGERSPGEQRSSLLARARDLAPLLGASTLVDVVERVLARVVGLGPLEPLLDDDEITEVMVNGDGAVWIEQRGRLHPTGMVLDPTTVLRLIERIVAPMGRRIDRSSPTVDARLADGSRVNAIVQPAAVDGPCLTIRRFGARRVELEAFAGPGAVALLRWAVRARCNLLISGGTGSGKTTLLNALAAVLPAHDRVVTIEDTAELHLAATHVVRLEAREANAEGAGALSMRELVRNALRMRPDRIVVGEVRGDEVVDMLTAMNTGHEGSLSTLHANSAVDALRRLESMVLLSGSEIPTAVVRELISSAVDLVVHVARATDGARQVTAIDEVRPEGFDLLAQARTRPLLTTGRLAALPLRPVRGAEAVDALEPWIGR